MKKVVIFLHGDARGAQDFTTNTKTHRDYEKWSRRQIDWKLIAGHLNPDNDFFYTFITPILEADVLICDADNSNYQEEVSCHTCQARLRKALVRIKELNPKIKIFIKTWFYLEEEEEKKLAKLGKIIPEWFWESVVNAIKK